MKQAINTRAVTIYLSEIDFEQVKQITDDEMTSLADWFRQATKLKLEQEKQEKNNEFNQR